MTFKVFFYLFGLAGFILFQMSDSVITPSAIREVLLLIPHEAPVLISLIIIVLACFYSLKKIFTCWKSEQNLVVYDLIIIILPLLVVLVADLSGIVKF